MNWLLVTNNLTSAAVVLSCWWLAHMNAKAVPPGRLVAAAYALVGFSVLFTMIVRNLGIDPRWFIVCTKACLAVTFGLTIFRRIKLGDR